MSEALKKQREEQGVVVPLAKTSVATQLSAGMNYLAKHATTGIPLRFNKEGKFILPTEGDKELPEGTHLAVIWDQARGGHQRLERGEKPQYKLGLIFGAPPPPERDELGELDSEKWSISDFSGVREDPWKEVQMVPLQSIEDGTVYVFSTMSITGLHAVANLLTQSARMGAKDGESYPVIKLRCGGYEHKKYGWVKVPAFERVGSAPKSAITAAVTSLAGDLNDEIPF